MEQRKESNGELCANKDWRRKKDITDLFGKDKDVSSVWLIPDLATQATHFILRLGIQTRAARGFAIPSSCGGLGAFGAWPPVAAITDQVAREARHFLSAKQPKMNALKLSIQQM